MTIIFLESSKHFGGQQRRLLKEAEMMQDLGHTVLIVCPKDSMLHERALESGHTVHGVPMRNSLHVKSLFLIYRIVRRHNASVLYSHSGKDSWAGGIVGFLMGVPLVRSRELLMNVKHSLSYNLFPARVLACSEAVKDHLIESGVKKEKVYIQYPPIDVGRFERVSEEQRIQVREEFNLEKHFPVLLNVAEFRGEKRQEDLVMAMPKVLSEFRMALLMLVGSGILSDRVRNMAARLGVEDQVLFCGEREDIPSLLANADVFVMPSSLEPFGMSPVEAMAAGVPVVVTDTGGLREIAENGRNAIVVPPMDSMSIAEAVVTVCQEEYLREELIRNGRLRAGQFDSQNAAKRLEGHFREVLT
jgi:glycosyltransferase involved in cell wall biosynthesis